VEEGGLSLLLVLMEDKTSLLQAFTVPEYLDGGGVVEKEVADTLSVGGPPCIDGLVG